MSNTEFLMASVMLVQVLVTEGLILFGLGDVERKGKKLIFCPLG